MTRTKRRRKTFRDLMEAADLTPQSIFRAGGPSMPTTYRAMKGERALLWETAQAYADFFQCSPEEVVEAVRASRRRDGR